MGSCCCRLPFSSDSKAKCEICRAEASTAESSGIFGLCISTFGRFADSLNENTFRQQFSCNAMAIIFATDFPGETRLSQHRENSVGCRNQAFTLKFRILSIRFALARLDDECNGDFW